jgi:hypothetical protein
MGRRRSNPHRLVIPATRGPPQRRRRRNRQWDQECLSTSGSSDSDSGRSPTLMTAQPLPPLLESDLSRLMVSAFPQNAEMAGACWDTCLTAGTVWSEPLIPANANATMVLSDQDRDEPQPP